MSAITLLQGDCLQVLATLPDESVQCCVTSPPYFGLRDYGYAGQIGLEDTPEAYVAKMVEVFREVKRVLRDDGTLWLNIGDSYAGSGKGRNADGTHAEGGKQATNKGTVVGSLTKTNAPACKPKDLIGIPWMLAFALRADGWYLRQDIIWAKPNPMPESVTDRCTKAHEYIFLLTKSARYYFDNEAIKEPAAWDRWGDQKNTKALVGAANLAPNKTKAELQALGNGQRNKRSVWIVTTKPFKGAHFATFPPDLIEPCILAGTSERGECPKCGKAWVRETERQNESNWEFRKSKGAVGGSKKTGNKQQIGSGWSHDLPSRDTKTIGWRAQCDCGEEPVPQTVLDPFNGAGTTGVVAVQHGRRYIGIDLNPDYLEMSRKRIQAKRDSLTTPMCFASYAIGADAFGEA